MKPLCLLDLDGTIINSKEGIINAATHAANAIGITTSNYKGNPESLIGPPMREVMRQIHPFTDAQIEEIIKHYHEYYSQKGIYENNIYPGIQDLLINLHNKGIVLAIATSNAEIYATKIAANHNIAQYFTVIMGADTARTREKKSEVITAALSHLGGKSSFNSIIMIGDREYDIIGAQQTSIKSIGITWGYGTKEELQTAGAKHIADTTQELYNTILQQITS